ncbi:unnamed protein product, partial [Owenia fusiformis]
DGILKKSLRFEKEEILIIYNDIFLFRVEQIVKQTPFSKKGFVPYMRNVNEQFMISENFFKSRRWILRINLSVELSSDGGAAMLSTRIPKKQQTEHKYKKTAHKYPTMLKQPPMTQRL